MSETTLSILIYLHVIFITVWVGSQVLVAAAVVPSLQRVEQGEARLAALETFTRRFNLVAWLSMIVIVLTGGLMVGERLDELDRIFGDGVFESRWGVIFVIKMTLWLLMVGAVGLHAFILGPRQLELNRRALADADAAAEADLRTLQRQSILTSVVGLLLSLAVLGGGAFMGNHGFSYVAT